MEMKATSSSLPADRQKGGANFLSQNNFNPNIEKLDGFLVLIHSFLML